MNYFKHSELANQYHVSLKTVHNWIDAAKDQKLNLKLHEAKSGTYIANTAENAHMLEALAEKGKKYRNTLHQKIVHPDAEFYKIYSRRQILDIINNLSVYREIPGQYNYMQDGAKHWDDWLKRLAKDNTSNLLKSTMELISFNLDTIDRLLGESARVNVVDLGVGNAFPVRELLGHLLHKGLLHRYVALDISPSMLELAKQNVEDWFEGQVKFEGHVRDMTYERFDDLLVSDMLDERAEETINLVLLLGATATNFQTFGDAIKIAYSSMNRNDLFLYADKLDTEASRRYFDFGTTSTVNTHLGTSKLPASERYILDLMGIGESLYDVEAGFNEQKHMRYIQVRLNTALTIEFKIDKGTQHVRLEKGEAILILRILHQTSVEIITEFEHIGFALLHSSVTNDRQYFLSVSGVEAKGLHNS